MTSHTPLDTDNWQYVDNYFKNPGDYSYDKHYAFDHHYRFSLKKACSDYVVSNKKCILRRFIKYDMNMKPYLIPFFATVALTATAQQKNEITSVLEILDVTNGNRTVVKEFPYRIEAPNWTPDGQWLLYNNDGKLYRLSPHLACRTGTDKHRICPKLQQRPRPLDRRTADSHQPRDERRL